MPFELVPVERPLSLPVARKLPFRFRPTPDVWARLAKVQVGQRRKLRLVTAMCAFPPKPDSVSRLSVHALVHDRLDLHDDLVGDNGVSVMSREGSGGIRDDRVDCNGELMAVRLNFRSPDLTCAPSNPEYQLMAKRVAHRVPKPWTKQDVRELKTHSRARTPVVKVSKSMKRTVGALRRRAGKWALVLAIAGKCS